jgi:predicted nucleic acid-binding protein
MSSIVVADAGPLHYLILIDCAGILAGLFEQVLIPIGVRDELLHASTPLKVRDWMAVARAWLQVKSVNQPQPISGLHRGEAEVLQLAMQIKAAGVLMDDLDGRAEARRHGLVVIGTIGILERAAEKRLIELPDTLAKLQKTNFFVAEELLVAALARDRQRRQT